MSTPTIIAVVVVLVFLSPIWLFLIVGRGVRRRHKLLWKIADKEFERIEKEGLPLLQKKTEAVVRGRGKMSGPSPAAGLDNEDGLPTSRAMRIGNEHIAYRDEAKHFLFAGATGSGKTQGINQMLQVVRARSARAVVADAGGHALEGFFEQGDLIFNPFDKRSIDWSPFAEIREDYDCALIAKAAVPDAHGEAKEWNHYAQSLLGEALLALYKQDVRSVPTLLHLLTQASREDLSVVLKKHESSMTMLCEEGNEKMLSNTRAILAVYLSAWKHLRPNGTFSVRDWIAGEGAGNWLYVTYRADQFEMLRHIVAMTLDLCILGALSLPTRDDRELWFVLDEVDSLAKVSALQYGLTKLRKYGGRCVLGLQTISQLRATYGQNEAQTLMANVGTKVILRAGDGETADYFSREIGHEDVERSQESRSLGGGQTFTDVRENRRIVLDSDLLELRDLEGYLKGPEGLTKMRLAYEALPRRTEAFQSGGADRAVHI